jgi:hypothetical protein
VVIAAGILVFVAASLFGAYAFGFALTKVSQEDVRADQILVEKLETIRMYDWGRVTSGTYIPTTFTASFYPTTNGAPSGVAYSGTVDIVTPPVAESYSNSLRQVTATLTWVSGNATHTRSMTTFVSQNGIQTYKP